MVAAGAVSFVGAHLCEVLAWRSLFDPAGAHQAWFLNSGRAVGFTVAWLVLTGAVVEALAGSAEQPVDAGGRAISMAMGAAAAMAAVLFVTGPGTLFPIALALGGFLVAGSVSAGVLAASRLRRTG